MEIKTFLIVFGTVFLAELGDKTQLATLLFAARDSVSLATVFVSASLALVAATGLAVLAGSAASSLIDPRVLSFIAGAGFVVIGLLTVWQAL